MVRSTLLGTHDIDTARRVHEAVWQLQYDTLKEYGIILEGSLFKPSMVYPGKECAEKATPEKIAHTTVDATSAPHD